LFINYTLQQVLLVYIHFKFWLQSFIWCMFVCQKLAVSHWVILCYRYRDESFCLYRNQLSKCSLWNELTFYLGIHLDTIEQEDSLCQRLNWVGCYMDCNRLSFMKLPVNGANVW